MSDWVTQPLSERTVNLNARRVPVTTKDRRPGTYPYYGASGVTDYVDGYLFEGLHLLVAEDGENLRTRKTPVAFLADGRFWVNNHAHVLRANERNDLRFLAYALEASEISAFITGSAQPKLTKAALSSIPITAPGLSLQRSIAATLGALDDKIYSNRSNITLTLKLLDATSALNTDRLPRVPLGLVASAARTTVNPTTLVDQLVDYFSLPAFDVGARPDRVEAESIMSNKIVLERPTILLSRLNPRTDRTWWAEPEARVPALASTEFACLQAESVTELAALWLAVRDAEFRAELGRRVTGTSGSHQRVRPNDLLSIEVPDVRLLSHQAKRHALQLLEMIHQRWDEINALQKMRNFLLPELLSGRIRVPELQEALP
jgi:type I restriction enzyme S subunit